MSIELVSRAALQAATRPTLADVEKAIREDTDLSARKRQDVVSALRTLAKAIKAPLDAVPAHPGSWREALRNFAPAEMDISIARWRNALSLCRFALKQTGLGISGRWEPMDDTWNQLLALVTDQSVRRALASLARYCSGHGIPPAEVDNKVASSFLRHLEDVLVRKTMREIHRKACKAWNRASETVQGWPQQSLTVPTYKTRFTVSLSQFPKPLIEELDRYLAFLERPGLLAPKNVRPLKPISVLARRNQFHYFMSALVHSGYDAAKLQALADLVAVDAMVQGLEYVVDPKRRPQGAAKVSASLIATALKGLVTKGWVQVTPQHREQINTICENLEVKHCMTEKNRARLRQFNEPENLRRLLKLPQELLDRVKKDEAASKPKLSELKQALLVEKAVIVELSLMGGMRRKNLGDLELGRTLIRTRRGFHIAVPDDEAKNEVGVEVALLPSTSSLLALFVDKYRPHLLKGQHSNWLFPGERGNPKRGDTLGRQMSACVKRECGFDLNLHLYRHILAKILLKRYPGAYGLVRSAVGHKDVKTTTTYYTSMERPAALHEYNQEVQRLRTEVEGTDRRNQPRRSAGEN